jgi:hypothetical protein
VTLHPVSVEMSTDDDDDDDDDCDYFICKIFHKISMYHIPIKKLNIKSCKRRQT